MIRTTLLLLIQLQLIESSEIRDSREAASDTTVPHQISENVIDSFGDKKVNGMVWVVLIGAFLAPALFLFCILPHHDEGV